MLGSSSLSGSSLKSAGMHFTDVSGNRILAIVAEKTGKFWRAWKSTFEPQA